MPQFIDAEVGLKYHLGENLDIDPLSLSLYFGEMIDQSGSGGSSVPDKFKRISEEYYNAEYIGKLIDFLDISVRDKLKNLKGRIVIVKTSTLYEWRNTTYSSVDPAGEGGITKGTYIQALNKFINSIYNGGKLVDANIENAYQHTISDLKKGIIPFFECEFATGSIYQKFSDQDPLEIITNESRSADNMIDESINRLHIAKLKELI